MANEKETVEEEDIITLEFDDGDSQECEIVGVFPVGDKEYIALVPKDDSGDYYIYGYKEVGEEDYELFDIDDEEEFNAAVFEFEQIMESAEVEEDDESEEE